MGKAKMTILEVSIPQNKVIRTGGAGAGMIGHTFTMRAKLNVAKRTLGFISGEGIEQPTLEWKETIDWFEFISPGTWRYVADPRNGTTKDLFRVNEASNTFKDWVQARYFLATDESNDPTEELANVVDSDKKKGVDASLQEKDKLAKHWIAEFGNVWTVGITDRPALGLNPTAGSGGGGGDSLVTSKSRRRVIHFDLGFGASRVTATQVLEAVNGVPTIHKFFVPGISAGVANDNTNLAHWRSQIGQATQTFVP